MISLTKNDNEKMSILVVEDDADDFSFLENIVKDCCKNASLQWVQDGDEAVAYLFRKGEYQDRTRYPDPSLIFLDIRIPKKNGLG